MEALFLKLLNMSLSASWIVLAVAALRLLLRRAPKGFRCAMWAVVGLRLVCPFSLESAVSLIPSAKTVSVDTGSYSLPPRVDTGFPAVNSAVNPVISRTFSGSEAGGGQERLIAAMSLVWAAGVLAMAAYFVVSSLTLSRRVRGASEEEPGVFSSDSVPSPFVFGFLRPRIYLPRGLDPEHRGYVLAHERAHISRRDYLIKPLAFMLLAVYWFNPAIWAAYILLCRDIELACDERVLAKLGPEIRKPYSRALLAAVSFRRSVSACPVAFGEGGLRGRIRNVLSWKKPVLWLTVLSVLICAGLAACFLTDPVESKDASYVYEYGDDVGPTPGRFSITLSEDGTFSYYEGWFSSYVGHGDWTEEDGAVTLTEERGGKLFQIRFTRDGDGLRFQSGDFIYIQPEPGTLFRSDPEANAPKKETAVDEAADTLTDGQAETLRIVAKFYDLALISN